MRAFLRISFPLKVLCLLLSWPLLLIADSPDQPNAITVDGGRYFGPVVDGKLHGRGRIEWANGDRYEGGFAQGRYSGKGSLSWAAGDFYKGEFREGRMSGQGRIRLKDGSIYTGMFRDDRYNGHGRYERGVGIRYEGQFKDDEFHGHGDYIEKGSKYRGEFQNGQFHGKGRYENENGEVYEGDFERGEFTGTGRYTHPNRSHYEGEFRDWEQHGAGRFTDSSGNIYEGQFIEGQMEGKGRYTGVDGMRYQGEFKQWRFSGKGRLQQDDGDVYVGAFANGIYEGQGTISYSKPRDDGRTSVSGVWESGILPGQSDNELAAQNVETALYNQRSLLDKALKSLEPGDPGSIDLYMLAIGGDGSQEVFRREVQFVSNQFSRQFGTQGRTISLVNSRTTVGSLPMATLTSIRESLQAISKKMNRDQDILFLFMTSHGSSDHEFVLDQNGMDLRGLTATRLGEMLRESGIRWKVVVVSACYGGGFIKPVKNNRTLIITAARHDRRSFGCADENDFTYFGRAFFKDSLPGSASFQNAFEKAEKLVRERELADQRSSGEVDAEEFSLPQMLSPRPIAKHLRRWWVERAAVRVQQ